MNRHLLAEWQHLIGPDDTIICLVTSRTRTCGAIRA